MEVVRESATQHTMFMHSKEICTPSMKPCMYHPAASTSSAQHQNGNAAHDDRHAVASLFMSSACTPKCMSLTDAMSDTVGSTVTPVMLLLAVSSPAGWQAQAHTMPHDSDVRPGLFLLYLLEEKSR